ncbi:reverse transcriptase domain-containing protein [Tanacetum coccineum]
MFGSKRSRDTSKYCHFHEDYGHDTNDCRHLKVQIQEAINSGQLSHLVKCIKKEKAKSTDTPRGEGMKDKSIVPVEAPILMISREYYAAKNTVSKGMAYKEEITFPPVTRVSNAPVIFEVAVFRRKVGRVYMDIENTCEVIYEHYFEKLNPFIKATRVNMKTPLVGFSGKRFWSVGEVPLEIKIGKHPFSRTETLNFVIVKSDSPHNMLLGRTAMQKMGIVVSTIHEAIKFHTKKESEPYSRLAKLGMKRRRPEEPLPSAKKGYPAVMTLKKKSLHDRNSIMVDGKPFNTEHKLNEYNHIKPIKQNKRSLGLNHNTSSSKEAEELTKAGILQKVKHQMWVANLVMVKKNDGGWRMCVDFTDINKACPKDCYPLPEIDWKMESFAGFRLKCFLDAYKGYHQIQMMEGDEDKTAFFVGEGVFCYQKMPSGLKNVGETTSEEGMLSDIQETFERFRSINMKLNPKKCSFGVEEGLFLGHVITKQGIKANPTKIKAVTELEQPRALKDIQSLNEKLAAFSRFLSKGAERSLPFFKVLKSCKGKKKIHWTDEADKAFKEIKKFFQALPTLIAPRAGETLTMYLTASKESINAALFAKRSEEKIPIYFVNKMLQGAKLNYPALKKLILALVYATRRLRRYFQAHTIMVPIGTPIEQALTRPEKTARIAKWAIELGEHDIIFLERDERETPADFLPETPFDDRAGVMLIDPAGKEYTYALRFEFKTTNDKAEYEALLTGLRIAQEMEITKVVIFLDSQLVVNQIKGTYTAKQLSIKSYLQKVKTALKGFKGYIVEYVRRNQNKKANALSKLASMTFEHQTKEVLVEVLAKRSIEEKEVLKVEIEEKRSWMIPIKEYLLSGLLLEDTNEARKIRIQVPPYKLIRGNLYKRSFFTLWLRCIAPPHTDKIIKEIHEGSCRFNAEPRSMVVRITKQGYYWPSMHKEASKTIQDCDKCKEQSAIRKAGVDGAIAVRSTWPFSHWGIHILGPLPMAPRGLQFLAIAVEHSTKWVEAKPITVKNARQVEKFVWEYVVCRFGTFSPITEHMEIMHYIEKQLVRSQQSWVDNLAKELWVHRTLPRNNQEETPFSLTYGSEAVVPIVEATNDRGRTQETTKKGKEIASIEKAHYRNKLRKYHNTRNNYSNYIVGDFVLFPTSSQEQQGPHMISEVHKDGFYTLVNVADHSLIQKAKETSLRKFYM